MPDFHDPHQVGTRITRLALQALPIWSAANYAAGKMIGGPTIAGTFAGSSAVVRTPGQALTIEQLYIYEQNAAPVHPSLNLFFWDAKPNLDGGTVLTDNSSPASGTLDFPNLRGVITIQSTDWVDIPNGAAGILFSKVFQNPYIALTPKGDLSLTPPEQHVSFYISMQANTAANYTGKNPPIIVMQTRIGG
jgi:hypothetical protein